MSERPRRRRLRRILLSLAGLLLLLFLLWLFRFPLFGGLMKGAIAGALESEGIRLEVADISGTLLFDVEVREARVVSAEGVPAIREASIAAVRASYSPLDLLRGRDDWLREVHVEGVRGTIDLGAPPGPDRPESPPSEGGGLGIRPRLVRLDGLDLTVLDGEDRLELRGARLQARSPAAETFDGSFGADLARAAVEGEDHAAHDAAGSFRFAEGVLTVTRVGSREGDIENVLRADLSGLDEGKLLVRLDLPLFGGRLGVDADADLSGDEPAGTARVVFDRVAPRPLLRFLPGIEADLEEISGTVDATLPAGEGDLLRRLDGAFDLVLRLPAWDRRSFREMRLAGTLREGVLESEGTFHEPDGDFRGRVDLLAEEIRDGRVRLPGLDLAHLGLTVEGREVRGVARVAASASGPLSAPTFHADVAVAGPSVGEYRADGIEVRAAGTPEEFRVESLRVARGGDEVRAKGRVAPGEPVRFAGEVEVRIGEMADYLDLLPAGVPADLAGGLTLRATADGTPEEPGAEVAITCRDPKAEGLALELLEVAARVASLDRIAIESLLAKGAGDLPDVSIENALVDLAGEGPVVTAGGLRLSRGDLSLASEGPVSLRSEGDRLHVAGSLVFTDLDAREISRQAGRDLPVTGSFSGAIDLAGTVDRPRVEVRIEAGSCSFTPPDRSEIRASALALSLEVADGFAELRQLRLAGAGWTLEARGRVPFDPGSPDAVGTAPLAGRIDLTSVPLGLAGPLPGLARLEGTLDAGFDLAGRVDSPRVAGRLAVRAPAVSLEDPALPAVSDVAIDLEVAGLGPDGGVIRLANLTAKVCEASLCGTGAVTLSGEGFRDPTLHLDLTGVRLERLGSCLELDSPVRGEATLSVDLEPGPNLSVVVAGRSLRYGDLRPRSFDLRAFADSRAIRIERAELSGAGSSVGVTGTVPIRVSFDPPAFATDDSRPVDLRIEVREVDLASIEKVPGLSLREGGIALSGRLGADLALGGPGSERTVKGAFRLADVRFRAPDSPRLSDFGGAVLVDAVQRGGEDWTREIRVRLENLSGKLSGGDLKLGGTLARRHVRGREPEDTADITVVATNALLARQEGLRLRSDLDLLIRGRSRPEAGSDRPAITVGGKVRVRGLRYSQDVDLLDRSPSLAPLPLTTDPVLGAVGLDVVFVAPPGSIRIRNNLLDAEVDGRMEIGGTLAVPRPEGRMHVARGKVSLPTVTMKLERAAIEFRASQPLRPYVDARTSARIAGYEVFADSSGPADRLKVELSSDPPLEKPDILSLIATGVPTSGLGAGSVGSAAASMLYRQISSELSGNGESDGTLSQLAERVELDVDTAPMKTGGTPAVRATIRLLGEWLYLRGAQEDALNYGLDLLFRLSFP